MMLAAMMVSVSVSVSRYDPNLQAPSERFEVTPPGVLDVMYNALRLCVAGIMGIGSSWAKMLHVPWAKMQVPCVCEPK